jgi:hypothetical protein
MSVRLCSEKVYRGPTREQGTLHPTVVGCIYEAIVSSVQNYEYSFIISLIIYHRTFALVYLGMSIVALRDEGQGFLYRLLDGIHLVIAKPSYSQSAILVNPGEANNVLKSSTLQVVSYIYGRSLGE